MDAYKAIMAAADHIETYPESYDFWERGTPDLSPSNKACALGWIGHYAGMRRIYNGDISIWLDSSNPDFYEIMNSFCSFSGWTVHADMCAGALRRYAKKYHAPKRQSRLPAAVRKLFSEPVT